MISIIICANSRSRYIYNTLESLAGNDFPYDGYEIVVVDFNVEDDRAAELDRFVSAWPDVNLHRVEESRRELSHARNLGIKEAKGDVLIFLADGTLVGKEYLSTLVRTLDEHPEFDSFGGKVVPVFEGGKAPGWLCKHTMSWVSAVDLGDSIIPLGKLRQKRTNVGFRRKVLSACDGFDDVFGKAGSNMYYIPEPGVDLIVPLQRTTKEYISRMGRGIGARERIRCGMKGPLALVGRWMLEAVNWGRTLALCAAYHLRGRAACGNMLVRYRLNVTKGLLDGLNRVRFRLSAWILGRIYLLLPARYKAVDACVGKTVILTVSFNKPELIRFQNVLLRKNITDDFCYIVADNSTDKLKSREIREYCRQENIGYVRLPVNTLRVLSPSSSHAAAVNWCYKHIIAPIHPAAFGIIDHDLLPVDQVSIAAYLKQQPFYGPLRERGDGWYISAVMAFFDYEWTIKNGKFNYMPTWVGEHYLDTGGSNWYSYFKNIDVSSVIFPEEELEQIRNGSDYHGDYIQYMDGKKWVHLINGSGWKSIAEGKDELIAERLKSWVNQRQVM